MYSYHPASKAEPIHVNPTRLTRRQLHDLAWSEPLNTVASRFGVSGVALKKSCDRMSVPVPPRGYWAKLQAGKKTIRVPLPERPPGMHDDIWIGRTHPGQVADADRAIPELPCFEESIEDLRARVRARLEQVRIPTTLANPHSAIQRLLDEDEARRAKAPGRLASLPWHQPRFDGPAERRRLRILNAVFIAAAPLGGSGWTKSTMNEVELGVSVNGQMVRLSLDHSGSPPSDGNQGQVRDPRKKDGGVLFLAILGEDGQSVDGSVWSDDPAAKTLEGYVREIATEILVTGEVRYREGAVRRYHREVEFLAQRAADERKRRTEQERLEVERLAQVEADRQNRLLSQAVRMRQADDIRAYVAAVCARCASGARAPLALEAWRDWALARADALDPVESGAFVSEVFGEGSTEP